MPETWTVRQGALAVLDLKDDVEHDADVLDAIESTTERLQSYLRDGKSIAYYINADLGHPMLGHCVAFSYGTPEAQFEGEPPTQCPDGLMREITGGINWRYQLKAVTPNLPDISEPDWVDPPQTRMWVAVDIAAEGPAAITVLEGILNDADEVVTWHIVNPLSDADRLEFNEIAERLRLVFEEQGPMEELPFGESVVPPESPGYTSPLGEHLIEQHGYSPLYVAVKIRENNEKHLVDQHDVVHSDSSAENLPKDHNHDSLRPEDL